MSNATTASASTSSVFYIATGCACESGFACDISHDPASCPCAQCRKGEASGTRAKALRTDLRAGALLRRAVARVESKNVATWAMSERNAPIWRRIAAAYVGKKDAEMRLATIIVAEAMGLLHKSTGVRRFLALPPCT